MGAAAVVGGRPNRIDRIAEQLEGPFEVTGDHRAGRGGIPAHIRPEVKCVNAAIGADAAVLQGRQLKRNVSNQGRGFGEIGTRPVGYQLTRHGPNQQERGGHVAAGRHQVVDIGAADDPEGSTINRFFSAVIGEGTGGALVTARCKQGGRKE